jgi:hypothetical protein
LSSSVIIQRRFREPDPSDPRQKRRRLQEDDNPQACTFSVRVIATRGPSGSGWVSFLPEQNPQAEAALWRDLLARPTSKGCTCCSEGLQRAGLAICVVERSPQRCFLKQLLGQLLSGNGITGPGLGQNEQRT